MRRLMLGLYTTTYGTSRGPRSSGFAWAMGDFAFSMDAGIMPVAE